MKSPRAAAVRRLRWWPQRRHTAKQAGAAWIEATPAAAAESAAHGAILVVSDDPRAWAPIRQCLEQEGYAVAIAPDATEALARVRRCAPNLVLLDRAALRAPAGAGTLDRSPVAASAAATKSEQDAHEWDEQEFYRLVRLDTRAPII